MHAPASCDPEVLSALRGLERGRAVDRRRVDEALALYVALPLTLHHQRRLLERSWELRERLSACDAAYVALAEQLDVPLVTRDWALARAAIDLGTIDVLSL